MRIGRWLWHRSDTDGPAVGIVGAEEQEERTDEVAEKAVRRDLNARLRAIELEYGLDLRPIKVRKVDG